MTERQKKYNDLSHAAWGYFFLFFDINFGGVSILPAFVGFLLFYLAARALAAQHRDFALLTPLCLLLFAYHLIDWICAWSGASLSGHSMFLDLLAGVASLYFHFQFLTDLAALAVHYQPENDRLDQRILTRRTVLVITTTAAQIISLLFPGFTVRPLSYFSIGLSIFGLLVALFVMSAIFSLRRCYWDATEVPS